MIALLNDDQAVIVRTIMVMFALVAIVIITVVAIESNHQEQVKKIKRQQQLDNLRKKEDEACGQYIIDQNEEYRRDFDDAS